MMDTLPIEIALDILSRLPVTCLTQIKCVCKAWCALGQDPRLSVLYHTRAINKDPCFILHRNSPIRKELYHVSSARVPEGMPNKATRMDSRVTSILPDHNIIGSCNGLLCISDALHIDPIYILNPFVGSHTRLPRPISYHEQEQEVTLGFGYHPISEEYKVVRITSYVNKDSYLSLVGWFEESDVQVFTLGMKAWRSIGTIAWRVDGISSEALSNGALHWVTMRREYLPNHSLHIVSFDLGEERFKEIELPSCGSLSSCNFHLISLQGCLSAAVCCPEGQIEIWIMKEYSVKSSWMKEYVIGTYLPRRLKQNVDFRLPIKEAIQVLCVLKNGEILLEYESCSLVLYNPRSKEFKELDISGLPNCFSATVHEESLLQAEDITGIKTQW